MNDDEILSQKSNVEIYCDVLLGFLSYTPVNNAIDDNDYREKLNKKLKFQNNDDHLRFRACIDLTEDTQFAINEFYENGLKTTHSDGEMYLRLYGILNAIYLQNQALIELIELFKIPHKKQIDTDFKNLDIIKIRNKIGAHTPNYISDNINSKRKTESYRLAQASISKWGNQLLIVSSFDECEDIDLMPAIKKFTELVEFHLDKICEKGLKTLFKNKSEFKDWMEYRVNYVRKNCVEQRI